MSKIIKYIWGIFLLIPAIGVLFSIFELSRNLVALMQYICPGNETAQTFGGLLDKLGDIVMQCFFFYMIFQVFIKNKIKGEIEKIEDPYLIVGSFFMSRTEFAVTCAVIIVALISGFQTWISVEIYMAQPYKCVG